MNAGENVSPLWVAAFLALLGVSLLSLGISLSIRARARKVEKWLVSEMGKLQAKLDASGWPAPQQLRSRRLMPAAPRTARTPPPPRDTPRRTPDAPAPSLSLRPREIPPLAPEDLTATLNEMLKGKQAYNFVEALCAMDPRLTLLRVSPRENAGVWSRNVTLEPGGDGFFVSVQDGRASLFPNYSRFSATLDPCPLFDGARHGGRILSVLRPALLEERPDGRWALLEKGRVQMRHGDI